MQRDDPVVFSLPRSTTLKHGNSMLDPNIKDALQITLNDHRMSRGEKRAMAKVIEQHVKTDHELSHARSVLFELARQELTDPQALKIMDWV